LKSWAWNLRSGRVVVRESAAPEKGSRNLFYCESDIRRTNS
jgi:hypothetical protein